MTIVELRRHILEVHKQPIEALHLATDDDCIRWHAWEHRPTRREWSAVDHAHDEFTAHRLNVPQFDPVTV